MAENILLRHPALTVLQQIEELKTWHKQQQAKLKTDCTLANDKGEETNTKNVRKTQLEINQCNTQQVFDEMPINVVNSNFNKVIENNINPIEINRIDESSNTGEKPKFPFLRKGDGIARFRIRPRIIPKHKSKNKSTLNFKCNMKIADTDLNKKETNENGFSDNGGIIDREKIQTLEPPDLKLDLKNWKSIFESGKAQDIIEKAIDNNQLELFQPNSSIDSSTASILEKCLLFGKRYVKEKEEQRVFEMMEQHVLDSSFCSTSSYVENLMKNAIISTPVKKTLQTQDSTTLSQPNLLLTDQSVENNNVNKVHANECRVPEQPVWTKPAYDVVHKTQDVLYAEDLEQSLHVKFADEVDYKSYVEYSESLCNSSEKEKIVPIGKEFNESEEWKEDSRDDSSQCSTKYSSSDDDVRPISPPNNSPLIVYNHRSNNPNIHGKNNTNKNVPVDETNMKIKENSNVHSGEKTSLKHDIEYFPPSVLEKLKELEKEIEIFRLENNKIKSLRETLEKERKQLDQQKKKLLKDLEEEKKKDTAKLEEEKQKLAREKFTFEKYSKSLTKNPTKEERKEIQALRDQLSELKEEFNKKESRWGAAQARVRNQVKLLEEDNKKLKEVVEALRKQSKHLETLTQKKRGKPFNNTKLIHAISNHISNIDVEEDKNAVGSYFISNSNYVQTIPIDEAIQDKVKTVTVIKENVPEIKSKGLIVENDQSMGKIPPEKIITDVNLVPEKNPSSQGKKLITPMLLQEDCLQNYNPENKSLPSSVKKGLSNTTKDVLNEDGNIEMVYPDGKKEIRYKNGNVKKIDPFTGNEKTIYFNGDVKEILKDGTIKYYFSESRIWHTTLPDKLEIFDYPNQQIEKRHVSGLLEIIYPNGCKKLTYPDKSEEVHYTDGTIFKIDADKKRKVLYLPNGQKEIQTDECVSREYPDGTVRMVYPDGTMETVYPDGRVRLKDKHGNLVMDSGTLANSGL